MTPPPPLRPPVARRTDPQTSHAAAASITADELRVSQRDVLDLMRAAGHGMTDEALAAYYETAYRDGHVKRQSASGLRTRRKELVEAGLVRDSGARARLASGRAAVVWEAVP